MELFPVGCILYAGASFVFGWHPGAKADDTSMMLNHS